MNASTYSVVETTHKVCASFSELRDFHNYLYVIIHAIISPHYGITGILNTRLRCLRPGNKTQHYIYQTKPGSAFIKPDQRNPWIKDQIKITLLPTISHLLLPNFVSCGRACPSHMTQNLVTVGAKLWTADRFIVDPWSMDYADPVW